MRLQEHQANGHYLLLNHFMFRYKRLWFPAFPINHSLLIIINGLLTTQSVFKIIYKNQFRLPEMLKQSDFSFAVMIFSVHKASLQRNSRNYHVEKGLCWMEIMPHIMWCSFRETTAQLFSYNFKYPNPINLASSKTFMDTMLKTTFRKPSQSLKLFLDHDENNK